MSNFDIFVRYLLGTRRSSAGHNVLTYLLNWSRPDVVTAAPLASLPAKKFRVISVTHWFFLVEKLSSSEASFTYTVV